jgi:hypothetical protein
MWSYSARRVPTYPWPENKKVLEMKMETPHDQDCSLTPSEFLGTPNNIAELDSPSGKMSQEPSLPVKAGILQKWLAQWQDSKTLECPKTAGARKAQRWATMAYSNGLVFVRNGSGWRNGATVCSLSSILETGPVDRRYFLSAKACAGILRRAEKRGKTLPEMLRKALTHVVESESTAAAAAAAAHSDEPALTSETDANLLLLHDLL